MSLRILIHNVGHGQSIHAFTPANQVIVIDLGCSETFSPLAWLRHKNGTTTIDSLVITHPHGDHIDEILILKKNGIKVRQFWRPNWLTEDEVRAANQAAYQDNVTAYLQMSETFSDPIPYERLIGNPAVTGGVKITRFASKSCGRSNINNHSGVVVFEYAGSKVIIPGDNEPPSWRELLEQSEFVDVTSSPDIFMASHHGRESGYCADLFDEKNGIGKPKLTVISDGRKQDTDATSRYSYHASGWKVHSRAGDPSTERLCVTTRSDGFIDIKIGHDENRPFLSVTKD